MKLYPDLELNQTPLHQNLILDTKKSEPKIDEFTLLRISETSPLYDFVFFFEQKKNRKGTCVETTPRNGDLDLAVVAVPLLGLAVSLFDAPADQENHLGELADVRNVVILSDVDSGHRAGEKREGASDEPHC